MSSVPIVSDHSTLLSNDLVGDQRFAPACDSEAGSSATNPNVGSEQSPVSHGPSLNVGHSGCGDQALRYELSAQSKARRLVTSHQNPAVAGLAGSKLGEAWAKADGLDSRITSLSPGPGGVKTAAYMRYSTGFQGSIGDQIRSNLEFAETHPDLKLALGMDLLFADAAQTGRKENRPGYQEMLAAARAGRFKVLLVFRTNRIARRISLALKSVVNDLVSIGIRVIFVSQNIDSGSNSEEWLRRFKFETFIDELGCDANVAAIRSAHIALFEQGFSVGRLVFGYCGKDDPTRRTKMSKLPNQTVVIDEAAAAVILRIFREADHDLAKYAEISRGLKRDRIPPPTYVRDWTPIVIRKIIAREEYIGWFEYGSKRYFWNVDKDRSVPVPRDEPLKRKFFAERQIVPNDLWERVQTRMRRRGKGNGGPHLRVNTRAERPQVLRGLLYCIAHNRPLSVGSAAHHYLCKRCKNDPAGDLCSGLPGVYSTELVCEAVAEALQPDSQLLEAVIGACQRLAAASGKPDGSEISRLQSEIERLTPRIRKAKDESEDSTLSASDREDSRVQYAELRARRSNCETRLEELHASAKRVVRVPSVDELKSRLLDLSGIVIRGAKSNRDEEQHAARKIIVALTGGRIDIEQRGERTPKGGWLVGKLRIDPMAALCNDHGVTSTGDCVREVELCFRTPTIPEANANKIKQLVEQGCTIKEAGRKIGISTHCASKALHEWYRRAGQPAPSRNELISRSLRKRPKRQKSFVPKICEQVMRLLAEGRNLEEVCAATSRQPQSIRRYITMAYQKAGIPCPPFLRRPRGHVIDYAAWALPVANTA